MKTKYRFLNLITAAGLTLGSVATAQTVVKEMTTTTNLGTVTEFSPDTIVIRSESASEPLRYSYTKTTTYVDEAGTPVSIETVKSGLPVTVYYTKEGDRLVASRVVVRKAQAPTAVEKKTTTTTTTTRTEK